MNRFTGKPSPYDVLIGTQLGEWTVTGRATKSTGGAGGAFSVCYTLRNAGGDIAFCKVLNYIKAFGDPNPVAALQQMTADFQHEVGALDQCRNMRMRRVMLAIDSSSVPDPLYPMGLLSYIIFEPAIGDLRLVLPLSFTADDLSLRFGLLHDAALGIAELHQAKISHQDVKPSNILAVRREAGSSMGKVADLGRAIVADHPHRFDVMDFPGDKGYAPPEYRYEHIPANLDQRRRGTDLYQLGSLIAFVLSGASMSALLYTELEPSLRWDAWRGDYVDIEPSLREATTRAIEQVVLPLPEWGRASVREMLTELCDPDPTRRNAMTRKFLNVSDFSLSRVVSALDRLSKRADVERRAA